jgi:rod shape-determining protein MreC
MYKRFLDRKGKEIIILLAMVLVLVTLNAAHRIEHELRWYDRVVLFVTAPVQYTVSSLIKGSVRLVNKYILLMDVKEDNYRLIASNIDLLNDLHKMEDVYNENTRLRKLLDFRNKLTSRVLSAEVIGKDSRQVFKTIRISKGEAEGIRQGMPVLSDQGLVGQVMRTFKDYSDVLLIIDPNSNIDSIVQNSRFRGVLEGLGKTECRLKYLERLDDVNVGDVILTSGMEKRFPKGLILGTVARVDKKNYGTTQQVFVKPIVDFSRLEEVLVVMDLQ